LKMVLFPTLGRPTIPQLRGIGLLKHVAGVGKIAGLWKCMFSRRMDG
jgi:hypothetical protein